MERSPKEKTTALQNSIEIGNTSELNLLHPSRYKQHNLNLGDGADAIAAIHDLLPRDKVYTNVLRAFETLAQQFIDNDKIVEHWDVIEEIPAEKDWKNSNGKF
jgi:predicted SnoaL-like aldol condensation-catalyzing enzyme